MSAGDERRTATPPAPRVEFDRHRADYRDRFTDITHEMHTTCPLAWTDAYDGHWVAAGSEQVFELARCPYSSNDHDINNERRSYKGISIPTLVGATQFRGGMLEMDDPQHRYYRKRIESLPSPAAVKRWQPFIGELVRACIDDHIETGRIDFVDDLANVVPAVLTLAMLGVPLNKWEMYNEPAHAQVYTPPDSPDAARVRELYTAMGVTCSPT